ncbi:MAG: AsmA-like C-terminal region-containing protein [Candidatus Omnitrophica bacterium]|nr:AsmA-like C-terminal region-containing protein [Candidatus Omnitrophota bacterium]
MRGVFVRKRVIRLSILAVVLSVYSAVSFWNMFWMKSLAEAKISEFLGNRFDVRVGEIKGGLFGNTVLQDVILKTNGKTEDAVLRLERVEISYRVWQAFLDKLGLVPKEQFPIKEAGVYFSERNPFIRGFVKIYSSGGSINVFGSVSPVIFGDDRRKAFKGTFSKRDDGFYDCDIFWDGNHEIRGMMNPVNKSLEFSVFPVSGEGEEIKVTCTIDKEGKIEIYSRLYRWFINGKEVVGDIWMSLGDDGTIFSVKAKNLLIDKYPVWDVNCMGSYDPDAGRLRFNALEWGGGSLVMNGIVSIKPPYPVRLNLSLRKLDLAELAKVAGGGDEPVAGISTGNIEFTGPAKGALVSGRLFVEKGVLGELEFVSMFATLSGNLPVIKVSDARVVKDGGHITVSGEVDLSKMREDTAMENLIFETDNKVAVWEKWQITKDEGPNKVEARKDRLVFCTSFEGDQPQLVRKGEEHQQQDMWFKYKLDEYNSLKMEVKEDGDFLGVEHKVQF